MLFRGGYAKAQVLTRRDPALGMLDMPPGLVRLLGSVRPVALHAAGVHCRQEVEPEQPLARRREYEALDRTAAHRVAEEAVDVDAPIYACPSRSYHPLVPSYRFSVAPAASFW